MKTIPLTQGCEAIVDDEDYEHLIQWKWYAQKGSATFYATRDIRVAPKKRKYVWMHRLLNKTPDGLLTDHINGNGLDNRKENLRTVDHQQNMINCARHKIGSSKYRGVSWHIGNKNWMAQITVNKKNVYIGAYPTEIEAKEAYDKYRSELRRNQIIKE